MLARSGVRVSELCDIRVREVRLHDPDCSRLRIPDASLEAGIREVQLTPDPPPATRPAQTPTCF